LDHISLGMYIGLVILSIGAIILTNFLSSKKIFQELGKTNSMIVSIGNAFDIFRENKEYFDMMERMKAHAVSTRFKDGKIRFAIENKCDVFISIITSIVDDMGKMKVITTKEYEEKVLIALDNGFSEAKKRLSFHIGEDLANEYYESYAITYFHYKKRLRDIFADLDNYKKKRVINVSNSFLLEFIDSFAEFMNKREIQDDKT